MYLIKNIIKKWDDFEINIPELEVLSKGVTVLSGPSGSGKSTILRILIGIEDCPKIDWKWSKTSVAQRRFGVVFQNYDVFPHLTARQNIVLAAEARGLKADVIDKKLQQLENSLNMSSFMDRKAKLLSGGERQRVALARALVGEPNMLFLDEPFTALDVENRQEARKLIKSVLLDLQIPVVMVTHDPEDVQFFSDKLIKIKNGQLDPIK